MDALRRLPWDWYSGRVPDNVLVDESAYLETTYSFFLCRTTVPEGIRIGKGASTYLGTMFDVGPRGRVTLGDYALVHGARIICDESIEIGDYALISWNVLLMDSYRMPVHATQRREVLHRASELPSRFPSADVTPRPIRIGANVWLGFESCVLPGVTIGDGAIVGARSVVAADVPPYTIVAGNPARVVRVIHDPETK